MVSSFLSWYIFVQLISLVTLPLAFQLFRNLPDRGYALSKSLGILLVGFTLWFGTSYGLLRNETGGAWLSILIVASVSFVWGQSVIRQILTRKGSLLSWRYIFTVELLFLTVFAGWAMVRAYDPAVNHTEQPMDLMFMNGIWTSPTYPPRDPWLAGYAISYYYFGYWLLIMLGHLAGQPPEITYNLGQACWYALLLLGCFGVGYNLLARSSSTSSSTPSKFSIAPIYGGLLASITVGVIGNLQGFFEWLYATGVNVTGLAGWFNVRNFPPTDGNGNPVAPTGDWFVDFGWWWWRSSRVIADSDLLGNHIEVIDEFPMFSYILGDNHPHVLAMPFILLVIGLALNLFFSIRQFTTEGQNGTRLSAAYLDRPSFVVLIIAVGSLIPLNTWDFPGAWALVMLCIFAVLWGHDRQLPQGERPAWLRLLINAIGIGLVILVGAILVYLPYFFTAQSQARGFVPNLFNPTQFSQFFVMFGPFLFGVCALIGVATLRVGLNLVKLFITLLLVYGLPILFLFVSITVASGTAFGQQALSRMALPDGADDHVEFIIERWQNAPWTFVIVGFLLSLVITLIWQYFTTEARPKEQATTTLPSSQTTLFVLFLAGLGLLLAYAPEFIYLLDNFGSRMNTVFKFYYQAWLLLGLSSAYVIFIGLSNWKSRQIVPALLSLVTVALIGAGMFFPVAAIYSKAGGFTNESPTLNSIDYIQRYNPSEMAAITWVRQNTAPDALIIEGKGASYRADYNRISTITGRPTLLGWDGHEAQWRGEAYGEMARGRAEALDTIYRSNSPEQIEQTVAAWNIDYVYLGPTERSQYGVTPRTEESLSRVMNLVFEDGAVQIYQRQSSVTAQNR